MSEAEEGPKGELGECAGLEVGFKPLIEMGGGDEMASFRTGDFGRRIGLGRGSERREGGMNEGLGVGELEFGGADGLEFAEAAVGALAGALEGSAEAGEAFETLELGFGVVAGGVEVEFEGVGAAELPCGMEELAKGVEFEGSEGQDFSVEGFPEVVEGGLLMGLDDEGAGVETVGGGVF